MDYSSESSLGQQKVSIDTVAVEKIAHLADIMQMLRAWYEHFERSLRELDKVAAIKVHDLIIEGVVAARQLARELGFTLPNVDTLDWMTSRRPALAGMNAENAVELSPSL